ncbi:F-box protein At5g07610-like isoform X2 [Cynara cardunculus var. scolymus]|uniref:F-box protein At5g07610-like isoform X2 n=1 Tax=Cynara cardunculus var. scolymus TaxID=59895 RepID=UPI000D62B517|nr:F-box protein At5g07610-like isoform X2 [Cynara cardunculus var. scolymus]
MMVGGGRASKKQIIDTEDKGLPSSAYEVLSYDDLLIEILLRLPAISLHLFKSVSKRWLSLITDPNFTLRRSQITNIDPPSGLFLQRPYVPYDYEFVPFDIRIPSNRSPINTTLAFGPDAGFHHGIYWNNAIHWLDFVNGGLHFKLDIEHPLLTRVQTPGTLDRKLHYVHKLLESRGRLLLVYPVLDSRQLKVYEMRNEYSGWLVKYIVNLDDMGKLFPKTWLISAKRFCIIVRSVVVGEREEDSYVVMEVSGKLIQYHIVLKTLRMIYGLASTCPPVSEAKKFGSFQFIASFAGV